MHIWAIASNSRANVLNASYWSGKAFSIIRYSLGWIWLAETKGAGGVLALIRLGLALAVGVFLFILKCLRGKA